MSLDESVTDAEIVRDATEQIWRKDVTERQVEEAVGGAVRRARADERRKLNRALHAVGETCSAPLPSEPRCGEEVGSIYAEPVRRAPSDRDRTLRDLAEPPRRPWR